MKILTVTLNPAIDRIRRTGQRGPGAFFAGGKGINVARAARALGATVKAIGIEGGITGWMLDELLDQEGIPHQLFVIQADTRVNTTRISKNGKVTRDLQPGPVLTELEREAFVRFFARQIKGYRVIVFSGSLPPRFPVKEFARLVGMAKRSGALVVIDTSSLALKAALKMGVDVIKPNRQEAGDALGFKLTSQAQVKKALQVFLGCGIKKVLISLGKDGLAAADAGLCGEVVWERGRVLKGGHSVGCGDAALAGFIVALMAGKDFKACVRHAVRCGGANIRADRPGGLKRRK